MKIIIPGVYFVFFLSLMLCVKGTVYAQEKIIVSSAVGHIFLSDDISISLAREKALNEARLEALRKAGVVEEIREGSLLFQQSDLEQAGSLFSSMISVDIMGEIAEWSLIRSGLVKTGDQDGYEVEIRAVVNVFKEKQDPSFTLDIQGIRDQYYDQDKLLFSVMPRQDGYLQVFILTASGAERIFPNPYEKKNLLHKGKEQKLPGTEQIDYIVECQSRQDIHYAIFLFTRKEFIAPEKLFPNDLLNFLAHIPPSEKRVEWRNFLVKRN